MKKIVSVLIISLVITSAFVTIRANNEASQPNKQTTIKLYDKENVLNLEKIVVKSSDLTPDCEFPWTVEKNKTAAGLEVIEVNNGKLSYQIIPTRGMVIQKIKIGDQDITWSSNAIDPKPATQIELVVNRTKPYKITIKGSSEKASPNSPNFVTEISTVPGASTFQLANTFDFANLSGKAIAAEEPTRTLAEIAESAASWEPSFKQWFGKQAPDFTITDLAGKKHKLSDYRGKNLIVNIWATWCGPCRKEIPDFIELRKEMSEDELGIFGISTENGQDSTVKKFVNDNKMNYTISASDVRKFDAPFSDIEAIPTTFFIDKEGKIKFATIGILTLKDTKDILKANK